MPQIRLNGWSLIPGPLLNPPQSSVALDEIVEYSPEAVASTFLSYPGTRLVHAAQPTWWDWKARWESGVSHWEFGMSLFETEPPSWGGSLVMGDCELEEFLQFCRHVRGPLPAVWLHNSACEIHSPESFARQVCD
jgi:hypothetical protein